MNESKKIKKVIEDVQVIDVDKGLDSRVSQAKSAVLSVIEFTERELAIDKHIIDGWRNDVKKITINTYAFANLQKTVDRIKSFLNSEISTMQAAVNRTNDVSNHLRLSFK